MGSKSSKERVAVTESQLIGFEVNRSLYFWIILIVSIVALLGNLFVVKTVITRKYKYLQKTCIISLALSDIMTILLFAMNNLDLLRKRPMTWIYGEYMCHFMPIGQVLSNLTGSVALLVIALDRYHNVIHALNKKWDPALWKCLFGTTILCTICSALAYPVVTFYIYIPITVDNEDSAICTGAPVTKSTIFLYYICLNCLFFMPMVTMFFWFYYKIALLIWKHRKPPSEGYQQEITETSSATKINQDSSTTIMSNTSKNPFKKKNVQMERKIRSFKIVLTLIVAFIGCRLPYWFFTLYQQVNVGDRNVMWNIRFSVIALYLLNCALNPFLYTFLNITIVVYKKVINFLSNTCCCWCSNSEFEDFESGKPPLGDGFMGVENKLNNNKIEVQFIDVAYDPKYTQRAIY